MNLLAHTPPDPLGRPDLVDAADLDPRVHADVDPGVRADPLFQDPFGRPEQDPLARPLTDGPRGHVAAPAYNYILRRFASFFAVRRATLRALPALGPDLMRLTRASADPFLRRQVEEVARAG